MTETIDLETLFEAARESLLQNGFRPSGLARRPKQSELTLHEAIRTGLAMRPDDSFYMYWNWEELGPFLREGWRQLDHAASEILGRRTSAIALCFPDNTSIDLVLNLFKTVSVERNLRIDMPVSRPSSPGEGSRLPLARTLIGGIVRSIAAIVDREKTSFGDVISMLATEEMKDVELLRQVDKKIDRALRNRKTSEPGSNVVMMRALIRAFQASQIDEQAGTKTSDSLSRFLVATDNEANWSGLSDESLLRRLLRIAPETSDEEKKRIEKYLSVI